MTTRSPMNTSVPTTSVLAAGLILEAGGRIDTERGAGGRSRRCNEAR